MSVSTEVQRTLVKSPPELWSELSNPEALARHLSGLGEIRITSVEPETKVEWESEGASGIVQLKQSGWGTRVTLSVRRGAPAVEQEPTPEMVIEPEPEPAVEPEPEPVIEPEPVAVESQSDPVAVEPEPVAPIEPDQEPSPVEHEPRLGFFARLFRKRRAKPIAVIEPEPEIEIEVVALAVPEPVYPDPPAQPEASEPAEDLASELESLEDQIAAETTELLTGVLDRLGAAHHRPFSRG
ncbi:MAG TPA: hypothetical protein VN845_04450 [Solirubrobacteraceae bacterium]|nr:hypothetical protein [Solirubrobacteraceae bacterium]